MDIRLLMRKKSELLMKRQKILDEAVNENRGQTEAESALSRSLINEVDRLDIQIAEAQADENRAAGIPAGQGNIAAELRGRSGDPGNGLAFGSAGGERSGFMRNELASEHRNFGQFVQDARWADLRASRGFSMELGIEGGYLVPDQFSRQILMVTPETSIVRSRATVLPPNDDAPDAKIGVPALDTEPGQLGGLKTYWLAEGVEKPETDAKLILVELEPRELGSHVVVMDKLLRNDAGAASIFLETVFRAGLFDEEDYAFLAGDGVGKPLGILNSDARLEVARKTSLKFEFEDVANLMAKFLYSSWPRACWVINSTVLPELIQMVDAGSHRVYVGSDVERRLPPKLLGIDVVFTGRTPILGTAGDVMLCDFSYYLIKTGAGPFVKASEHHLFTENKTVVKAFYNVDGSPWVRAPIKMRDGVTEASPFVILK